MLQRKNHTERERDVVVDGCCSVVVGHRGHQVVVEIVARL